MGLTHRLSAAWHALAGPSKAAPVDPIGAAWSWFYPQFINDLYSVTSADDLIQTLGISVYREMERRDDQVQSCVGLQQMARLAPGWEIAAASDDPKDQEIRDFVEDDLGYLEGQSFDRVLWSLMDAIVMGFVAVEKRYRKPYESGYWAGMQGYRKFFPLAQETIKFDCDEYGEIKPDGVWQIKPDSHLQYSGQDPDSHVHLPRDRFVIWSWMGDNGNPMGRSPLRAAYRYYFGKTQGMQWWGRWLEYYGVTGLFMKVPKEMSDSEKVALLDKLRRMQFQQRGILNNDQDLQTIEPTSAPGLNFDSWENFCNRGIARSLFTPATLVDLQATGSYALSNNQKNTWESVVDCEGRLLESEAVHQQIIRPLVELNFGTDVDCPKFRFKAFSESDRMAIATMFKLLADGGFPVPLVHVSEALGVPIAKDGEPTLGPSTASDPFQQMPQDVAEGGTAIDDMLRQLQPDNGEPDAGLKDLLGDAIQASRDPSGDDLVNVLRGNGRRSKSRARDEWR